MSIGTSAAIGLGVAAGKVTGDAIAASKQSKAEKYSARLQSDAATRAGELEYRATQEALAFQRDREATREREHRETQAQNYRIYLDEQDYTRGLERARLQRLAPYRRVGAASLGQLAQPIPGSLGALVPKP